MVTLFCFNELYVHFLIAQFQEPSRLIVMGGHQFTSASNKILYNTTEGFDLSNYNSTCRAPKAFPVGIDSSGAPLFIKKRNGQEEQQQQRLQQFRIGEVPEVQYAAKTMHYSFE